MRTSLAAGFLAVLILGATAASALADDQGSATFAEALAQARQQNRILVIDFYTDW